jgi:predicted transcriptional regulator
MKNKGRKASLDTLSRREREIIHVIFSAGNRASSEEIRAGLTKPPTSSAVRAMLTRLESKGVLRHEEESLRYVYSVTTSPTTARRAALQQYLSVFFGGSREELMTTLLTQESWTREELDALQAQIDRVRKGGSR